VNLLTELRTERLWLRKWLPEDRAPFARLNADPRVMEFFPGLLSREESDNRVDLIETHFQQHGFGLWAVEIPETTRFAGFIGISIPRFEAHFTPCIEIGWRLAAEHWNRGHATEGARAVLEYGFKRLCLKEIVSYTVPHNLRSRRVMEKIGMTHSVNDDFDHPLLPEGHPLRRHVFYRIGRPKFEELNRTPEPTNLLMLEFLRWVASRRRTYAEAMEAWRSSCPRQTVWEDALAGGFIEIQSDHPGQREVVLAPRGRSALAQGRAKRNSESR
jgi:RimJ/RimL family protein N-acetyltransferase